MRRSKPALAVSAACLLAAALSLTACTTTPAASPTETADTVDTADCPVVEVAGTGPVDKTLTVPDGAASLRVNFVCLGGYFTLSVGGAMENDRSGGCDGTRTYLLPATQHGMMQFSVHVPEDSHFALTAEFTTDVFTPDPLITAACAQLSDYTSLYLNADQGYQRGAITSDEWRAQMDDAVQTVTELQKTATGLIALQLPALVEGISSPVVVPGYFLAQRTPTEMDAAGAIVSDVCSDNGSGLAIMAEYGG